MAEAIHCPSCSTRYRLRPERLKPVLRRARCYTCGHVFPVGDVVQRLLAAAPAPTASFDLADIAAAIEPAPEPPPSLTLGDLADVDAEILEKTLVDTPSVLPETKVEAPLAPAAPGLGGYASARDAIDKLFGGAPTQSAAPKATRSSDMDMEATLTALEATLGGHAELPPAPADDDAPTASGRFPRSGEPSTTTVRLSQEDLRAALALGAPEAPAQPASAPDPMDLTPPAFTEAAPLKPALEVPERLPASAMSEPEAEQLRLKIDEEVYPGLTMSQLTAWIEEGRILEHHLVARQHSENWLEAYKVPTLRPVFDRLRRERGASGAIPAHPDTPPLEIAPKKSLFGGLFGKG